MDVAEFWSNLEHEILPLMQAHRARLDGLDVSIKSDSTFLTEADIQVEEVIVQAIRKFDANAVIVAEEDNQDAVRADVLDRPEFIWVVDPIDGTAQFIEPAGREFCSVICLLQDLTPVACLIIAPELGLQRTPVTVSLAGLGEAVRVNGAVASTPSNPQWVSITRSSGVAAKPVEKKFLDRGYSVKTRTTSQTLDMLRVAVDLEDYTDIEPSSFALFVRQQQKLWDGVAGIALARSAGLVSADEFGRPLAPFNVDLVSKPAPVFPSTLVSTAEALEVFLTAS